ncbi:uncharacterized protein V1513DRAFT_454588 [Lipomyces chichibuensis]|uniref:uncharacterized protein n=1 Tax=Lipomyces chichibuensis TaxID=1546026 RepID=UPI0033430B1C
MKQNASCQNMSSVPTHQVRDRCVINFFFHFSFLFFQIHIYTCNELFHLWFFWFIYIDKKGYLLTPYSIFQILDIILTRDSYSTQRFIN